MKSTIDVDGPNPREEPARTMIAEHDVKAIRITIPMELCMR